MSNNFTMKSLIIIILLSAINSYTIDMNLQKLMDNQISLQEYYGINNSLQSMQTQQSINDARFNQTQGQWPVAPMTGFDVQVNEETYILGTGDGITIYLWGTINNELNSTVDHEGNFIIPSIGVVNVKGKTLKEGKKLIKEKLLNTLKKVDMSIILSKIREFKVYVLGELSFPGPYTVNGATRVSDLVTLGGGCKKECALRNIEITNSTYPTRYADLGMFYHSNVIEKNPYLIEGDRVFIHKPKEIVSIFGTVNYPGVYEYMPDDSLMTILLIAGGLARGADSSRIIVKRFLNDKDSLITFECSFYDSSVATFKINRDDRILVSAIPDYRVHRQVILRGEIKYPGIYPIQKDRTKLIEVIGMAGGLTEDAFLKGSKIIRKVDTKAGDKEFERLRKLPTESLSPLEKSYLKTRLTEEDNMVSINFEDLLNKGSDVNNIILLDGDEISIAHKNLSIKVTGAVISPGLIEYKEGADINYYIKRAGGFNSRARKHSIQVMKGGTEIWLQPREVKKLEPGDAVWIPEKQYRSGYSITKEMIIMLGAIATIIISAFTINEFVKRM